jgi:hypothetical protein
MRINALIDTIFDRLHRHRLLLDNILGILAGLGHVSDDALVLANRALEVGKITLELGNVVVALLDRLLELLDVVLRRLGLVVQDARLELGNVIGKPVECVCVFVCV